MPYFNEELNSMLRKRQEVPATDNTNNNNQANSQPFPDLPPSPNNNSVPATKAGGIGKFQLIGIIVGAFVILGLLIGFFIRKKITRNRTRNVIRINDVEWDSSSSTGKTSRAVPPQQLRNLNYEQDMEGEKSPSRTLFQYSPQFSKFSRDQDDSSTLNISSPLDFTPTKSEFDMNSRQGGSFYSQNSYESSSRRLQPPQNSPYHLPRSPRSPLIFKNKIGSTDSDSDQDTLEGTPRSPYFFKGEPSINDQDTEDPPRSPYFYNEEQIEPVPTNTNDQDSTYLSHQDESDNALPVTQIVDDDYDNYTEKNENIISHENILTNSDIDKNDIIKQLDSDLDNIITKLQNGEDDIYFNQQYQQFTNDLPSSSLTNGDDDALSLSLPSPFKLSWTKDSSYTNDNLLTPLEPINEESNGPYSQANSIYSESRPNSIPTNENVQMDYVQPTQGMIQIEMMNDHIITRKDIRKESIHLETQESEFDSPQSEYTPDEYTPNEYTPDEYMPDEYRSVGSVDNESQIVAQPTMIQTIELIENEIVKSSESSQTDMNMEISAPILTETTRPEILASKPDVVPVSSTSTSPMYDIAAIKRHAEKVLNAKTAKKEGGEAEDNEIKENYKNNESSDEETNVRKKSVRFQAAPDDEETLEFSNFIASKSIKDDEDTTIQNDDDGSEDEEANNRNSTSSYEMYDFDISSYQDNTGPTYTYNTYI